MNSRSTTIFILAGLFLLLSCCEKSTNRFILNDFETESDLDRVNWKCYTLFSLSTNYVTHGNTSLRFEFYPSDYPGFAFNLDRHNWSSYKTLAFDIYNPTNESLSIALRIDDKKDYPTYEDRFTKTFILEPGMNHLRIPLTSLITPGTQRLINLKNIYRLLIFMAHPKKKYVVYIDFVHLI